MAECSRCNVGHAVRQFQTGQTGVSKRIGVDSGEGILREVNGFQSAASIECVCADALYALFHGDRFQRCAVCEHGRTNGSQIAGDSNGFQGRAVCKYVIAHKVQACRELNGFQIAAGAECAGIDRCHAVREFYGSQRSAAQECVCTDADHGLREGNRLDLLVAVESRCGNESYRILFLVLFVINGLRNDQIGGSRSASGDLCLFRNDLIVQLAVLCRFAVRQYHFIIFCIVGHRDLLRRAFCGDTAGQFGFHVCCDLCRNVTCRQRFLQSGNFCYSYSTSGGLRCCVCNSTQTAGNQCSDCSDACNGLFPV